MKAVTNILLLAALTFASSISYAQQLPIDINQIDQLTPEQRAQAMQLLGQVSGGGGLSDQKSSPTLSSQINGLQREQSTINGRIRSGDEQADSFRKYSQVPSLDDCGDDGVRIPRRDDDEARTPNSELEDSNQDIECGKERRGKELYEGSENLHKIKPFGYDLFSGAPSTFAPATDIPVPSDYVLGPGDTVRVLLYGNTNENVALIVGRDGNINFPKLGPISVAGLRFEDASSIIETRVTKEMIGVQCNVTLGELRSIQVYLLGDVNQPGSYTVSSLSTVTNALLVGGGVSLVGSLRNIQLKRQGHIVRNLDLYDLLLRGDSSNDERLQPGDVIFVPPVAQRVTIYGEVKRAAIYELKGETRLSDLVTMAGGLMASTSTNAVEVTRYDDNKKSVLIQVDASRPADLALRMQDGDRVRVRKLKGPTENNIRVAGFVRYPGYYEWSRTSDLAQLLRSSQVLPSETGKETYLPLGLIERTDPDSGVRSWSSFNTRAVILGQATEALQPDDLIVVLSRDDISYLGSKEVRDVANGDFTDVQACPALKELASVVNSERSVRFIKALRSETNRFETSEQQFSAENRTSVASTAVTPGAGAATTLPPGAGALAAVASGAAAAGTTASTNNAESTSDRVQNEDQDRLQAAARDRLSSQSNADRLASAENVQCPKIFKDAPGALPFLLDQAVAVYGEVAHPGLYPVSNSLSLKQIVEIAGGRTRESDGTNVEYVSYADALKSGHPTYQQLDLNKASQASIGAGDIVTFKPLYSGQEVGTVIAAGEFRFPATYGILRGERLSQLISRAGGLTENAYPDGAVFTRLSAAKAEQESYHRAARDLQEAMVTAVSSGTLGANAPVSAQFVTSILQQLENAPAIGRVVINAHPEALKATPDLDPILEPGDAIVMPKRPISVTVIGQVLNPGTQQYMPDLSVGRYIRKAGGYTQAADEGRTFVILPNGTSMAMRKSFWYSSDNDIPAGSVIVVPRDATPFSLIGWSDRIFSVVSQMAVTAAALNTISR